MDEIALLPFRPWKGRVFMDEIGMPGISQDWFFLFFYFVKKTICVFCRREGLFRLLLLSGSSFPVSRAFFTVKSAVWTPNTSF